MTWPAIVNGFATGSIFVPLTMLAVATLEKQEMGNATGIYNLMRNIVGSFGIAAVTTLLARRAQVHQNILLGLVVAGNPALQHELDLLRGAGAPLSQAFAMLYQQVVRQAILLAYAGNFRTMAGLALCCVPLVILFRRVRRPGGSVTPME